MKNKLTEHSQKLRIKTANEWQKKQIQEGAFRFTLLVTDKRVSEILKKAENKTKLVIDAIKKEYHLA